MEDVKTRLANVGNLDDLKNRLAKMKEVRAKLETPAPSVKVEIKSEKQWYTSFR